MMWKEAAVEIRVWSCVVRLRLGEGSGNRSGGGDMGIGMGVRVMEALRVGFEVYHKFWKKEG